MSNKRPLMGMLKSSGPTSVSAFNVPGLSYGALLSSGPDPTTAGTGYVPNEQITLTGGSFTTAATLRVLDTKVVSATVAAGGTGGSAGTQTVTGTTGTTGIAGGGGRFQASVTVAGGAITAVLSITVPGDYIVNPTSIAAEPVTGASLTGATLNLTMGVLKFVVLTTGTYSAITGSPVTMSQGSTTGSGSGATFPISFAPLSCGVSGGNAAAGGFSFSPRLSHTGDLAGNSAFTAQTPVTTEFYFAEVFIPANATLTGVGVFNSATISGNMKVGLANSAGVIVATSVSTAMSGTSTFQRVPFTGTYPAVGPATYYVCVFYDNATVRPNTHTVGNFGTGKSTTQTYATGFTTIAAPSTFTTAIGPVATLY